MWNKFHQLTEEIFTINNKLFQTNVSWIPVPRMCIYLMLSYFLFSLAWVPYRYWNHSPPLLLVTVIIIWRHSYANLTKPNQIKPHLTNRNLKMSVFGRVIRSFGVIPYFTAYLIHYNYYSKTWCDPLQTDFRFVIYEQIYTT